MKFIFQQPTKKQWLCLLLVLISLFGSQAAVDDNVLHIGGIFPIGGQGGWQGGQVSMRLFVIMITYWHF